MKVIDLSGYSFSGKSAVYDLLLEFEGFKGQGKEFEFDLLRIPGGILDLKQALVDDWSPVRSSEAYRRFGKLVRNLGGDGSFGARLTRLGTHYERQFPGFEQLSRQYMTRLCEVSWESSWPFAFADSHPAQILWRKLLARLLRKDTMRTRVYLSRPDAERFMAATRQYLAALMESHARSGCRALLLNNAFEPFAPEQAIAMFDDARCIVVDRDPRDIYLSALRTGRVGNADVGRAVIGASVDDFIARFKLARKTLPQEHPRVLRIRFEELVEDYAASVQCILEFLQEPPSVHVRRGTIFRPDHSARGVRQWLQADADERLAIARIEQQLSSYCH